jgi:hypothetical protein
MDMKIEATLKMRQKCDMFPEEKNYQGHFPRIPTRGASAPFMPDATQTLLLVQRI